MSEELYDKKIAPLLKKAAKLCKDNSMSMVCVTEFEPNCTGTTITLTGKQGIETTMTFMAAKARGNADVLLNALVKHGKEKGHNSYMLERLGA